MGSDSDMYRAIKYYDNHKEDYIRKLVKIKRFLGIPIIWVKKDKYRTYYYLFNFINIMETYTS